jgi:hypothetical protein
VDDVRTSQEIRLQASTACYGESFTSAFREDLGNVHLVPRNLLRQGRYRGAEEQGEGEQTNIPSVPAFLPGLGITAA